MLWLVTGLMLIVAVLVVVVPVYHAQKQLSATTLLATLTITVLSAGLYYEIGTPDVQTDQTAEPDVEAMVASLATRLQSNPNDVAGWKMLARSYFTMRNFPGAIAAFEKASALEEDKNSQTLSDLAEAVLYDNQSALLGRAGELFENALALQPDNPKALFYGGLAAVERGNKTLGAERWEALLASSPPPNVQEILRQRIAELRGTTTPSTAGNSMESNPATPNSGESASAVAVTVALGEAAKAAELPNATVFLIARDPERPSPPIAAVRRQLSELPATVSISDADAMIPGRVLSGFATLEIIARVSLTGQPIAASGDWFGQQIVDRTSADAIDIVIDQQVP